MRSMILLLVTCLTVAACATPESSQQARERFARDIPHPSGGR